MRNRHQINSRRKAAGSIIALGLGLLIVLASFVAAPRSSAVSSAIFPPVGDAFIASGRADQSFNGQALWVGYDQGGGYGAERALLKFSPTASPGMVVTRASLTLWLGGTTRNGPEMMITAHRLRASWDEKLVRWIDIGENYDASTGPAEAISTEFRPYTWDVTELYKAWLREAQLGELSILLKGPETGGQNERAFWSKDCATADCVGKTPVLELEYVPAPTNTPTRTPTPTSTPQGPWAAWQSASTILLHGSAPRDVYFEYGNGENATVTVSVDGAARFADNEDRVEVALKSKNGLQKVTVYALDGARQGAPFRLVLESIGDVKLGQELTGTVAYRLYLPVLMRGYTAAIPTPRPIPSVTVTATNTPTATPSPTVSVTHTPTVSPTPSDTPGPERIEGTVWSGVGISAKGISNARLELSQANATACLTPIPLTPEPTTDAHGKYSISVTKDAPYWVCVKSKKPNDCSEIKGNEYESIVKVSEDGQIVTNIDFTYACP